MEPPWANSMRVHSAALSCSCDVRKDRPHWKWFWYYSFGERQKTSWAPAGFARGFCVLSDVAEIQYMATGVYNIKVNPEYSWNDPEIVIKWPVITDPVLAEKIRFSDMEIHY